MSAGLQELTNATNVQCYLVQASRTVAPSLALFVDPMQRAGKTSVASCVDGEIVGTPLRVSLRLSFLTPNLSPEQVRARLIDEAKASTASGDGILAWAVENNLLRINISLASFPQLTAGAARTEVVKLPTKPMAITKMFTALVTVTAPGQTDWSFLHSNQRLSEEGDVSRRLQLGSISPEAEGVSRSDSEPSPAPGLMLPVVADTSRAPVVDLQFFPRRVITNTFTVQMNVFNEIGVNLTIRVMERPVTRERKHGRGTAVRNVVLAEETIAGEPTLIVSFRADQDFGPLDLAAMTHVDLGKAFDQSGERPLSHLVAEAQGLRIGCYSVSIIATRAQLPLPTEKEVYVVVRAFLEPHAEHLEDVEMGLVRDHVFNTFKELNRISPVQRQELNQMTWSCTRFFILNTLVEQKADPTDDVDDIILSAINRQGGGAAYLDEDQLDEL